MGSGAFRGKGGGGLARGGFWFGGAEGDGEGGGLAGEVGGYLGGHGGPGGGCCGGGGEGEERRKRGGEEEMEMCKERDSGFSGLGVRLRPRDAARDQKCAQDRSCHTGWA